MGIGVLNDGPIKTPRGPRSRQLVSTVTSGEDPFLPAFAENAGFDLAKVARVQVDNNRIPPCEAAAARVSRNPLNYLAPRRSRPDHAAHP
jgi:hypothetical protein